MRLLGVPILIVAVMITACARRNETNRNVDSSPSAQSAASDNSRATPPSACINLNRATAEQLMQLPGIGEVMSQRIIAHRERHGPFRRAQDIIIIEGFSERKYHAIEDRVCVD